MEAILKTNGTNCLLAKADVGHVKPSSTQLPSQSFVYGRPNKYDIDAIKRLTSSWNLHQSSADSLPGVDYIRVNKAGCGSKATTAKQIAMLRKRFEPRQTQRKTGRRSLHKTAADCSASYGKLNRPSTPIKSLLANSYGEAAERKSRSRYELQSQLRLQAAARKAVRMTRAFDMRIEFRISKTRHNPVDDFKIHKFKSIRSKVRESLLRQSQSHIKTRNEGEVEDYQQ